MEYGFLCSFCRTSISVNFLPLQFIKIEHETAQKFSRFALVLQQLVLGRSINNATNMNCRSRLDFKQKTIINNEMPN